MEENDEFQIEGKENQKQVVRTNLFSQHKPELNFYRPPALSNVKGFIRKNQGL